MTLKPTNSILVDVEEYRDWQAGSDVVFIDVRDRAAYRDGHLPGADLLGEHLIADTYADQPAVLAGVLQGDDSGAVMVPLDVYTRAVVEYPRLRAAVTPVLSSALEALCDLASAQAASTTDVATLVGDRTLAAALDRATSVIAVDASVLPAILDSLPQRPNLTLSPLALTLTSRCCDTCAAPPTAIPTSAHPCSLALNNESNMLSGLGRRGRTDRDPGGRRDLPGVGAGTARRVLARTRDGVEQRVEQARRGGAPRGRTDRDPGGRRDPPGVAQARPDAFLPDLAMALNNESNMLSGLERREDALTAIQEALKLVLPMLELSHYCLPDAGLRLAQGYLKRCQEAKQEPDESIMRRMLAVLRSAGVITNDQQ